MARPSLELITALRKAAKKIERNPKYQWGHMGSCNCGHLAQELTHLNKAEIHEYAMRKSGDWSEQSGDYCENSKYPMDLLISTMMNAGMAIEDFRHLEKLSDHEVLFAIPFEERHLHYNKKEDVVKYMLTWASLLEAQLVVQLPSVDIGQGVLQLERG